MTKKNDIVVERDCVPVREHLEALGAERDRRYAEVNVEKEKALKIKETADLAALQLAREIQTYKDEKANELREQISSERGLYPTKDDLTNAIKQVMTEVKPLAEYVASQRGRGEGLNASWAYLLGTSTLVAVAIAVVSFLSG